MRISRAVASMSASDSRPLPAQGGEDLVEPVGQGVEHRSSLEAGARPQNAPVSSCRASCRVTARRVACRLPVTQSTPATALGACSQRSTSARRPGAGVVGFPAAAGGVRAQLARRATAPRRGRWLHDGAGLTRPAALGARPALVRVRTTSCGCGRPPCAGDAGSRDGVSTDVADLGRDGHAARSRRGRRKGDTDGSAGTWRPGSRLRVREAREAAARPAGPWGLRHARRRRGRRRPADARRLARRPAATTHSTAPPPTRSAAGELRWRPPSAAPPRRA
jgi:hypothetical protein